MTYWFAYPFNVAVRYLRGGVEGFVNSDMPTNVAVPSITCTSPVVERMEYWPAKPPVTCAGRSPEPGALGSEGSVVGSVGSVAGLTEPSELAEMLR